MVSPDTVIDRISPLLGAADRNDLGFWTVAELTGHCDDAIRSFCKTVHAYLITSTTTVAGGGGGVLARPANHLVTVAVWWDNVLLRPLTAAEADALNPAWRTITGTPTHFLHDEEGGFLQLYPAPSATGACKWRYTAFPSPLAAPDWFQAPDTLSLAIELASLAAARIRTSRAAMPESADQARQLAMLLADVSGKYWGF